MLTPSPGCIPFLALALAVACTSSGPPKLPTAPVPSGGIVAPVTYTGRQLRCADCPGIQLTVTLLPDSTFRVRRVYQNRPRVFHRLGRWSVEENGTWLALRRGTEPPQLYRIVAADTLRPLDRRGEPMESSLNHPLLRAPQVDSVRDTMELSGMYTYMADAGRFTECGSGATFPVALVGANAALERAYVGARAEPGAPLLVTVRGHFEERPAMEGPRRLEHVVVDSFGRVWPGATCDRRMSNATLENTYWKLLELGGQPARVAENSAEPHLLLHPARKEASGSTGCNRFVGPYELSGDSLRLGPLASTRNACLDPGMNRQESTFLRALSDTRTWQVTGDTLVLLGEAGPVARLAAVYLR